MGDGHSHRPTLKQENKRFKSKHATKSSLKEAAKGLPLVSPKSTKSLQKEAAQRRLNRKNAAKQEQTRKRSALISAARIFQGTGGAPRMIAVIPLSDDIDVTLSISTLARSVGADTEGIPSQGTFKLRVDRFKSTLQFIILPYGSFYSAMDAIKVADYTLLLMSSTTEVTSWGENLLRTVQAQGLPTVVPVVAASSSSDVADEKAKDRRALLKSLLSFIQYFAPHITRVYDLENAESDSLIALRSMCEGLPSGVRWREGRVYLCADSVDWEMATADDPQSSTAGTLKVTGVVRGAPLSPNRLIHIPEQGDFQIQKIMSFPSSVPSRSHHEGMDATPTSTLLAEPDSTSADSLVSTNQPDDMMNEQTWPTEDEMKGLRDDISKPIPDAPEGTTPKTIKRVPKGTSQYQAAWIIDEEDENEAEVSSEGSDEEMKSVEEDGQSERDHGSEVMEDLDMATEFGHEETIEEHDAEEESRQLEAWRNREREEADEAAFPDEVDTPKDIPARTRFQRYRGLRSFRTSPWDPFENLPRDYAKIFQFEDFKRTERRITKNAAEEDGTVQPGTRVVLYLKNVPRSVYESYHADSPFVLFGLFKHEHKNTVLHFKIQRDTEYEEPVRSKDPMILCVGPRRLRVNPIYSQHTRGGGKGVNNVHKFERYLRPSVASVATVFGPIVMGKQPCILLKETDDLSAPQLVATGTFLNPDTTRIIAKRIVLTGHPFKVHKRTATIRYMFFNLDDVAYYKPIQLHTKHGRTGHIKESLGTHGYYKAHFDGPITQMDTVCLTLYKRVFPKWSQLWKPETPDAMET
ncbi:ribosome biogenesis protein tsr1 [Sistotremastrum suecicum HHB10207 ss-3]|uniref:Ribosome biogenesis protein tsr1 n=1 Tax=Sistotremastrum suecicum HHB10207 ss-3 TaxID=1314776 RepID=A0A166I8E2_9AGAM|nr:ribosome biogenesis protein tsr1 [Sistotremastrum suecicum HHB10207 ss-3]